MQKTTYQKLLDYSFRLLSRKNYTEAEVLERLLRRGKKFALENVKSAAKQVISRLCELGYVNDAKILENYFEYRLAARPQGKFAFIHEMRRRGIPFERARAEWEKRGVQEGELAVGLLERKKRLFAKLPTAARKKKIAQLLASRGFSPETVFGMLDNVASGIVGSRRRR